jgi:hypothetical protein
MNEIVFMVWRANHEDEEDSESVSEGQKNVSFKRACRLLAFDGRNGPGYGSSAAALRRGAGRAA